jgi:hypothetical protein
MVARGKLEFQLVKGIIKQGYAKAWAMIQQDLNQILHPVEAF